MDKKCLCRHFYTPPYNREILTRTEHMNLLATPKGYRWYEPGSEIQRRAFRGKRAPNFKRRKAVPEAFPGMAKFMHEIWDIITPDILLCIKGILEEEFQMSPRTAIQFIIKQYLKSQRLMEKEACGFNCPTEEQADWARNISGKLASKITQFAEMMTNASRTQRAMLLRYNLMMGLKKTLGIDPCEETPLNKLLWRTVDGLSVWLSSLPGESTLEKLCTNLLGEVCPELCLP